ncbi:hypothetical protein [Natrinema gelatinilyticum]|uniref:hypothetical protein n=1 Tax=Natrinema gelatinilyticum TaxID=2961571 RepID=UPI0020C39E30|nr:hypothetical protein [Natrinema gelatinilyticum]
MATESPESDSFSLIQPRLLVALVVIATLAISVDLVGLLNLFGVETITDAITPFLVMVIGGYLGIVISDRLL